MKNRFIFILLLVITVPIFAQNTFSIEGGYIPTAGSIDYTDINDKYLSLVKNALYVDIGTRLYAFNYFFSGGSVLTYMMINTKDTAMFPFYTSYSFNAGLTFGAIEIGYEHRCSHPVAAVAYIQEPLFKVDSSSDKVYIKYEVTF